MRKQTEFFKKYNVPTTFVAVFSQRLDGEEHITEYASHTLNCHNVNYNATEKKLLVTVSDHGCLNLKIQTVYCKEKLEVLNYDVK